MSTVPKVDLRIATLAGSTHDAALFQRELQKAPPSERKALREAYHDALVADHAFNHDQRIAGVQTAVLDGVLAREIAPDLHRSVGTAAAPLPSRSSGDASDVYEETRESDSAI